MHREGWEQRGILVACDRALICPMGRFEESESSNTVRTSETLMRNCADLQTRRAGGGNEFLPGGQSSSLAVTRGVGDPEFAKNGHRRMRASDCGPFEP